MNLSGLKFVLCLLCAVVGTACWADARTSGQVYLSPQLQSLQDDVQRNPVVLWLERGQTLWQAQCTSCHGAMDSVKRSVGGFPRLSGDGKTLVNLEDQILLCQQRGGASSSASTPVAGQSALESDSVLSLSAALHQIAKGERIQVAPSSIATPEHAAQWQARLSNGQRLYQTRIGRMNLLACIVMTSKWVHKCGPTPSVRVTLRVFRFTACSGKPWARWIGACAPVTQVCKRPCQTQVAPNCATLSFFSRFALTAWCSTGRQSGVNASHHPGRLKRS